MYLIGVDNPVLDFSGSILRSYTDFNLQGGGSFYAENITFYDISGICYFATMIFNNCIFTSGGKAVTDNKGLYIADIYNLIISNCLFRNNDARSELIVITSPFNVEISGCEFYQNLLGYTIPFLIWNCITAVFMTMIYLQYFNLKVQTLRQ